MQCFQKKSLFLLCFLWLTLFLSGNPGQLVLAADLTAAKTSQDGNMALIPIDPDNVAAIKELLPQLQNQIHGASIAVYTPVGLLPQLVISGDAATVSRATNLIQEMFLPTGPKHMVVISASLRQLSDSDNRQLGLNLMPSSITYDASFTGSRTKTSGSSAISTGTATVDAYVNNGSGANILEMSDGNSVGKILVASEVFTPNGVKAEISDVQHVPVFSVDSNKNVQTDYQDLETSIAVTPTVMTLDTENPLNSTVRLDVGVKINIVSGEKTMGNATAPQYAEKKYTTTRVFPANGKTYIVGTFVSDSDIKSTTGVPLLMKIPLLKYLFSQESIDKSRSYAVLTLSVKVLPAGTTPDQLTNPWFEHQKKDKKSHKKDEKPAASEGIPPENTTVRQIEKEPTLPSGRLPATPSPEK